MIKPRIKSLILVCLKETHIIVTLITAISIIFLRSVHSLWFGIGTLIATGTAKLLKKYIRQPRPNESNRQTYGMPSTHSSSISFFAVYLFLSCLLLPVHYKIRSAFSFNHHQFNQDHWPIIQKFKSDHWNTLEFLFRFLAGLGFVIMGGLVCWSRIKLGHHTPSQVVVGAMIGGTIAWYTRDSGLIWDGLARPTLNEMANYLGLGHPFINRLAVDSNLHPLKSSQVS
ncbi:hypothetical protein O181_052504 [Austropuccinia psidii MF-1]|uniref:Phosphatidic acid phosphatase type 2/haloperoxidase domain-containing protein n=1 Tax=Austropuccinia psidii MF-1 TaxID=1389203 RepID=A0A9Q3E0U4_9BASI|nr:hypothetical protein [Austropuccinia psidii MF-1]